MYSPPTPLYFVKRGANLLDFNYLLHNYLITIIFKIKLKSFPLVAKQRGGT
jgi:hypothetical protein